MCACNSDDNGAFSDYKIAFIVTTQFLSPTIHTCFPESIAKAFMVYVLLRPLTVSDELAVQTEGIILVLMSWAVRFACVGIKLYKRHLCQEDGQCLRRLLKKIKDNMSCECDYNVVGCLWKILSSNICFHILLG